MNFIAFPEIFGDRLGLRRRFDDDNIHATVLVFPFGARPSRKPIKIEQRRSPFPSFEPELG